MLRSIWASTWIASNAISTARGLSFQRMGISSLVVREASGDATQRLAALDGTAVGCIPERRQRLVGIRVVRPDLVDAARVFTGRHLAVQLAGDANHLLDLLHARGAFALAAPEVV